MNFQVADIVEFNDRAKTDAAKWCRERGIKGKIISIDSGCLTIETPLAYPIWAHVTHVSLVAKQSQAPIPDDLGASYESSPL